MFRMKGSVTVVATLPHRPAGVHGGVDDGVAHCAEVLDRGREDVKVHDPIVVGGKGIASGYGRGGGLGNMENSSGD